MSLNNNSILIGNKSDLEDFREVDTNEGKEKAKSLQMIGYEETSAKNDVFVEEAFKILTQNVLEYNLKT